jgi:acid phosphatase
MPADGMGAQVSLACNGTCDSPDPIVPIDEGLKWYRRSAERRALSLQSYGLAQEKLGEKIAGGLPANWAVVFDIDETTLNNSAYQQARLDLGVGYSPASWTAWVNQKSAPAIDGVVPLMDAIHHAGGKVILVSNRMAMTECPPTLENLAAVGIHADDMLCKTDSDDKNPRFAQVEAAHKVIMYVGDNIKDFPNLSQDIRKSDASAFAKFGEDYILIPNSMYGSFDKNPD